MPNKYGNFFCNIANAQNAELAIRNASIGKRGRAQVATIFNERAKYAEIIATTLRERRYTPSPSIRIVIKDGPRGKEREIVIPQYWTDQCVHWMLMQELQPIIMRGMYEYSCGSVPGRGTKKALDAIQHALETDPKNCVWCMKLDIEKFYQHVDHDVLKTMFRKVIKDPDVLRLIDMIIDCVEDGVPIGYYTSQWFANFYLQAIDHYIKEVLKIPHYVRYVDDMILFASCKRQLIKAKAAIESELGKIKLKIRNNLENTAKKNWEIFKPREMGVEFIGTKFYAVKVSSDKHRYEWKRVMSRDTMLRMSRRAAKIQRKGSINYVDACAMVSYYGIARSGNNWRFEKKWLRPKVNFEKARQVVSIESKKQKSSGKVLRNTTRRYKVVRCDGVVNLVLQPQS